MIDAGVLSVSLPWLKVFATFSLQMFWKGSFVLGAVVLILNKEQLQDLNVDKPFIFIFLSAGIFMFSVSGQAAFLILLAILYILVSLIKNKFKFAPVDRNFWKIAILIFGIFLLLIICTQNKIYVMSTDFWESVFIYLQTKFALAIFEEFLYRGMFWMFLASLNVNPRKIVLIQAILFWLSHTQYLFEPFVFWVTAPIVSLLLGFIVLRSKSITLSSMAHILYNAFVAIV
jgi:membrane protease YdiL (CAAX protease family)